MKGGDRDRADGLIALGRETADALGRLTLQHLRLARLELRADLRAMGLQAASIAALAAMGMVGYGLAMSGVAALIGGYAKAGLPLLLIGCGHVLAASVGIMAALVRVRRMRPMNATADEVARSLAPLTSSSTRAAWAQATNAVGDQR